MKLNNFFIVFSLLLIAGCNVNDDTTNDSSCNVESDQPFDIDSLYDHNYDLNELKKDTTLVIFFDNFNIYLDTPHLILSQYDEDFQEYFTITPPITSIDTFSNIYSDLKTEKMWICNFESKLIKEYLIVNNDTTEKAHYKIDPVFKISQTPMFDATTGDELNKYDTERYLEASTIKELE